MPFKCETLIVVNSLIESFSFVLSIHFLLSLTICVKCCPDTDFLMTVACLLSIIDEQRRDNRHILTLPGVMDMEYVIVALENTQSFLKAHGNHIMGVYSRGLFGHMSRCLFIYLFILDQWFSNKGVWICSKGGPQYN